MADNYKILLDAILKDPNLTLFTRAPPLFTNQY